MLKLELGPRINILKTMGEKPHDALPLLSIGQMIELLCNTRFCFPHIGLTESSKSSEKIVVGVYCMGGGKELRGKTFEADELADALWEAIKAVL